MKGKVTNGAVVLCGPDFKLDLNIIEGHEIRKLVLKNNWIWCEGIPSWSFIGVVPWLITPTCHYQEKGNGGERGGGTSVYR